MPGNPAFIAAHLLAEFSIRAEQLLDAARRVRAREADDAVHDLRVATRRLSDILSLWRSALDKRPARRARRSLDRLRRALGTVREHEVHFDLLAKLLEDDPPTLAIAGRVLQSRLEARLERDRRRAARAARAGRIARILARVERASAGTPARVAASPEIIADALARARQREAVARAALHQLEEDDGGDALHQARIEAKKARYTLECMNAIGVKDDKRTVRAFRRAQRELGAAHDWATLATWIERERAKRLRHLADTAGDFAATHEDESIAALSARVAALEQEARAAYRVPEELAEDRAPEPSEHPVQGPA